jgi:nicotinate phosphoribosyltransferase
MIIQSILDTDLYKLTMQKAVLAYRQNVPVSYIFNNRRPEGKFNRKFMDAFFQELKHMSQLALTVGEAKWLESDVPYLGQTYIEYLRNYRFDPSEITAGLIDGNLELSINGTWERTILWEVPLMALISELYFRHCDTNWTFTQDQHDKLAQKAGILKDCDSFADFGTRRRRSFEMQDLVVSSFKKSSSNFLGTSNVYLAYKYNVKPIGTMAHEWIMGISALESLRHANKYALKIWSKVFDGRLGIALTDTFGTESFFKDFDGYLARLFDGVRHDSGEPLPFAEKVIEHYVKLGIHPMSKMIVFSDGLNPEYAAEIAKALKGRIRVSFGIGTNFTNDFSESKALNMVIKLSSANGIHVVKLSDTPSKAIGNKDALRVAKWTFFNQKLDEVIA